MRGQTQALTTILITTVIIGSIATAYVWGTPLLEKRGSEAKLQTVESSVMNLHESIITASQSGEGATTRVQLTLPDGEMQFNPEQDYIDILVNTDSSPYPSGTWILVEGKNLQNLTMGRGSYGIRNEDLPGVVAVRASSGGNTVIRYRIEFRNMKDPASNRLHKIDLKRTGRTKASGDMTLLISNEGTEIDQSVRTVSGENLERHRTLVDVDIQ